MKTVSRILLLVVAVVVLLEAGGTAMAAEKFSPKELQQMVGKNADQLQTDHADTLSSITKIKKHNASSFLMSGDKLADIFEMKPWHVWMFTNQNRETRYVVFSGKGMVICPGHSEASIVFLSSAGEVLGRWTFSTGSRIDLKSASISFHERLQAPCITIKTDPVSSQVWDIAKQYFAIVNDTLYFIRMENSFGVLKRNDYELPGDTFGGSLPAKTVAEWKSLLESPSIALRLAALTYAAGSHTDPDQPAIWGNGPNKGQICEGHESVQDAAVAREFRLSESTKKRLEEYRHSENIWLKEAAYLATAPALEGANMMGKVNDGNIVGLLIASLKDANGTVRKSAAEALGDLGGEGAIEPLIACLTDREVMVGHKAKEALGKLGVPAVERLFDCLKNNSMNMRGRAVWVLKGIKDERVVERLIGCLKDQDPLVRVGAVTALGKPGNERAVEPLIACLKDPDWIVRRMAAHELGLTKNKRAFEPLVACLKAPDRDKRSFWPAASALGDLGDVRAVGPLMACLKDEAWSMRGEAAWSLGKLRDRRAVESLIACLKDENRQARWKTVWALGRLGDARAIEPLTACLIDPDHNVRNFAAEALRKLKIGDAQPHAQQKSSYSTPTSSVGRSSPSTNSSSSAEVTVVGPDKFCVGFPAKFTASGGTPPYIWTSSDPDIATVDDITGEVIGMGGGNVTIIATDSSGNANSN